MPPPRSPSPRRRLIAALTSLAAGALATLATAWGPEVYTAIRESNQPGYRADRILSANSQGVGNTRRGVAGTVMSLCFIEEWSLWLVPNLRLNQADVVRDDSPPWVLWPPEASDGWTTTTASGWPWRAAFWAVLYSRGDDGNYWPSEHNRWILRVASSTYVSLPLGPIWPGLLADMCFWSAFFALATFGPGALRRAWRRRRSRCETCGYPLHNLPRGECPECGALPAATDRHLDRGMRPAVWFGTLTTYVAIQ
ncbi:MAG: hypothetical protein KF745_13575 [Phycisphaeraceae bacterium]|nr:hypothetical protein [Phycisphaeraceae bacterium]